MKKLLGMLLCLGLCAAFTAGTVGCKKADKDKPKTPEVKPPVTPPKPPTPPPDDDDDDKKPAIKKETPPPPPPPPPPDKEKKDVKPPEPSKEDKKKEEKKGASARPVQPALFASVRELVVPDPARRPEVVAFIRDDRTLPH